MKPNIALLVELPAATLKGLEAEFIVHRVTEPVKAEERLNDIAPIIRAIVTHSIGGLDRATIESLPHTEIIGCFGVGYDAIDLAAAKARNIPVTNTPDVLNDDVADLALALILDTARRASAADRYVRAGDWPKTPFGLGRTISGKTLGIVGLGRIGKAIAKRAAACGMTIAYHGRTRQADVSYSYVETVLALAHRSDVLVLAAPGGSETFHLVDKDVLDALGPEGFLINIGRGSLVDETALIDALRDGNLGGAGLDVFEHEPQVPEALLTDDRVVLLPHIGSATIETRYAMGRLLIDNLRAHFAGQPLLTPVV